MLGVLVGIAVLVWHVVDGFANDMREIASVAALFFYTCGLVVVVCHFDNIDAVMILHQEIEKTKAERERLEATKNRIKNSQRDIQTIVDLWMVRTIPLLDLTKEICERFRDACTGLEDTSELKINLVSTDGMNEKTKDLAVRVIALNKACELLEDQFDRFGKFEDNLTNPLPKAAAEALCANVRKRLEETHTLRQLIDGA